jgi:Methyltransferase domain
MLAAGQGELLRLVQAHYPFRSFGCDYTDKLVSVPGPGIDAVDLNRQSLPYSDQRFALVTCVETVEHWAVRAMNSSKRCLGEH